MQAVRIHSHGGPEVLQVESIPRPEPMDGEVVVQIKAAALNHLDLWARRGIPGLPLPMRIYCSTGKKCPAKTGEFILPGSRCFSLNRPNSLYYAGTSC